MNREQAVTYLKFSGFSEEQIKAIEGAFTCDKCVYSASEGCQYDDITETIPPFEDCISRQAVLELVNGWVEIGEDKFPNGIDYLKMRICKLPSIPPQAEGGKE